MLRSLAQAALTISLVLAAYGGSANAQPRPPGAAEGKRVFQAANCVGCHKWHGNGGGGYGGDALSLRQTELTRDQIIVVISCGRPTTAMPYFQRGVYDDPAKPCYDMSRADLDKSMPVESPGSFLRPGEIDAVADYVIASVKGKGEPNLADCEAFFGSGARVCNIYRSPAPEAAKPNG